MDDIIGLYQIEIPPIPADIDCAWSIAVTAVADSICNHDSTAYTCSHIVTGASANQTTPFATLSVAPMPPCRRLLSLSPQTQAVCAG